MRAINPNLGVRPEASQFAGSTGGGSIARFASRTPFSDSEERMLASQLLEVANEAELEQVLRDLSTRARRGVEPVGSTPPAPLEALLKTVSKKALPSLATALGASSHGAGRDATTGKLGSLLDQALSAKVAGMPVADPDLKKCRQVFERYRQFVRLAGKATKAAAAAPLGVAPVAVAHKILGDAARKILTRTATVRRSTCRARRRSSRDACCSEADRGDEAVRPERSGGRSRKPQCANDSVPGDRRRADENPGPRTSVSNQNADRPRGVRRPCLHHLRIARQLLPMPEYRANRPLVPRRNQHRRPLLGI